MRRTVGITLHGDRGHADDRTLGQPLLQIVVLCLALGETLPPAIVVYHDRDMIGIVEGLGAAVESGIVEIPFQISFEKS